MIGEWYDYDGWNLEYVMNESENSLTTFYYTKMGYRPPVSHLHTSFII